MPKIKDVECPVCVVLKIDIKRTQNIMIFYEDIVIAGAVQPNISSPRWTVVGSVEAVSALDFISFPQQGACVSLQYQPCHALYVGGYEADRVDPKDKFASSIVSAKCYYLQFFRFDYLTLDGAPSMSQPRFLHQAVSYYDDKTKTNILYAIGGIC